MNAILSVLGLSFLGSIAGLIGGIIFFFNAGWARKLSSYAVPFAAGVLLAVSFLDLLPEAVEVAGISAFSIILVVFVVLFLIERFLFHFHHHNGENSRTKDVVPLVIFGDTVHNLLDGVAIGTSFLVSPYLGLVVALATFLHETPHEIADFGILLSAGWSKGKAFLANFISATATFPGAILAFYYSGMLEKTTGILLSVAAGFFLYVAATDFLPATKQNSKSNILNVVFFLLGVLVIFLVGTFIPHV